MTSFEDRNADGNVVGKVDFGYYSTCLSVFVVS